MSMSAHHTFSLLFRDADEVAPLGGAVHQLGKGLDVVTEVGRKDLGHSVGVVPAHLCTLNQQGVQ
jgi:hypothetical protein